MHCLMNLDVYAVLFQTGKGIKGQWDKRWHYGAPRPRPDESFPSQRDMMQMLRNLRTKSTAGIEGVEESELHGRRYAEDWWKGTTADAYVRTIMNTMSHIRQIWLLRGALGLTDGKSWPQQHWA